MSGFGIVLILVAVVGVLGAVVSLLGGRTGWESYGRDHLLKDSDLPRPRPAAAPTPGTTQSAERDSEIRQMLLARNLRRARREQPPLDVEAELAREIDRLAR